MTAHSPALRRILVPIAVCLAATGFAVPPTALSAALLEDRDGKAALFEAYYAEKELKDYDAARRLYDQVQKGDPSAEDRRAARAGADRCRDYLIAQDFASVMPPESVVYVEIRRPGEIARQLAGMLGLNDKTIDAALAQRPSVQSTVPFHIPSEIVISPALFDALGAFGGAALALTDLDVEGDRPPTGVLVIHHGDVTLLKGMLETAFQFAPTAEKIRDLPTFGTQVPEVGTITGVLTESLLVVGVNRNLVEGVVARIQGDSRDSLASNKDLRDAMESRGAGTLFAYVDLQKTIQKVRSQLSPRDIREFEQVNAFADLDSLRWATLSFGIDDDVLAARLAVRLADDHHSLVYNLLRLSPMGADSLSKVPGNAAAIVGVGLNPELQLAAPIVSNAAAATKSPPSISGFDIGREFFGNLREVCAYVVPGSMTTVRQGRHDMPVPNVGVVMAVNDSKKSMALWNELLRLPGLFGGDEPVAPQETEINGTKATAYAIPEFGRVYLAEVDHCVVFGLTRDALKASLKARESGKSILNDDRLGVVVKGMPQDTSILMAAHIGRLAEVATGVNDMEVAMVANPASQICRDTVAWMSVCQAPNQFSVKFAAAGLPQINSVLKQFGPVINAATGTLIPRDEPPSDVARKHKRKKASKPSL